MSKFIEMHGLGDNKKVCVNDSAISIFFEVKPDDGKPYTRMYFFGEDEYIEVKETYAIVQNMLNQ